MQTFHRITCFSSVCLIEQVIQAAKHIDAVQQLILCSYRQVIDGIRTFQVGLLLTTFVVVVQQGMAILITLARTLKSAFNSGFNCNKPSLPSVTFQL